MTSKLQARTSLTWLAGSLVHSSMAAKPLRVRACQRKREPKEGSLVQAPHCPMCEHYKMPQRNRMIICMPLLKRGVGLSWEAAGLPVGQKRMDIWKVIKPRFLRRA
eukprot:1151709-Pelagomonas_calceolata.AAC.2